MIFKPLFERGWDWKLKEERGNEWKVLYMKSNLTASEFE